MIIPSYGFWYFDDPLISKDSRADKSHDPLQQKRRKQMSKTKTVEKREKEIVFVGGFKIKNGRLWKWILRNNFLNGLVGQ